jgi:hypothetical protein
MRVRHATLDDLVPAVEAAVPLGSIGPSGRETDTLAATAGTAAVTQDAGAGHVVSVCLSCGDGCGDDY